MIVILFFVVALLFLGISSVYAVGTAATLIAVPGYPQDEQLQQAHTYATWAAIVGWVGVALLVGIIILYFAYASETFSFTGGYLLSLLIIFTLILLLTVGILGSLSAATMAGNPNLVANPDNPSYRNSIITAVTGVAGSILLAALFIFLRARSSDNKPETNTETTKTKVSTTPVTETVADKTQPVTETVTDKTQPVTETVADKTQPITETVVTKQAPVQSSYWSNILQSEQLANARQFLIQNPQLIKAFI